MLKHLYSEIIISLGVFSEVVEKGWGLAGSLEIDRGVKSGWIKVKEVNNKLKVRELMGMYKIHFANAETVQLVMETEGDLILADELEVRELAIEKGLKFMGCLGGILYHIKWREGMNAELNVPERIKEKFLREILEMYSEGEISAGRAAEMLGIPRATFYELLAQEKIELPEKLNESIVKELRELQK